MRKIEKWCCFLLFLLILFYGITRNEKQTTLQKLLCCSEENHWQMVEGVHSKVYYKKEKGYAEVIQRQADTYYNMIATDFEWDKKEKIDFVLFETKEEFVSSLLYREKIPMGVYYNGVIAILSPNLWEYDKQDWQESDYFLEKGPVVHEMIHFAVDDKTKGNCEPFLSEGIALYYEKKYTGFVWYIEENQKQQQITKEQLKKNFNQLDSSVAYWKSYEWIENFVECYGEKTLQQALKEKGEKCY